MSQLITIDSKSAQSLVRVIESLIKEVTLLRQEIGKGDIYGSNAWWKKSTKKALDEFKRGKVTEFSSLKETLHFLHS